MQKKPATEDFEYLIRLREEQYRVIDIGSPKRELLSEMAI